MLGYYARLALRSFRDSKAVTVLIVVLIGLGVATCMVAYAMFRVSAGDPLPGLSANLFVPQIDNFGPKRNAKGEPPDMLNYTDAVALWRDRQDVRLALVYPLGFVNDPVDGRSKPALLTGDAVTRDFFGIFDVPFRFGRPWSETEDQDHASVVVISDKLNQKLFGGADSTGRELLLDGHVFRVAGVLSEWLPRPRFYDVASVGRPFADTGQLFVPFGRAIDLAKNGSSGYCSSIGADPNIPDWNTWLHSECVFIGAWVELRGPAQVERYRRYLTAYADTQRQMGRFAWAPNIRLPGLGQWLSQLRIIPKATTLSMIVAASFLFIAIVNVVGLMLARFMRRAGEIGVRRALGASRHAIYGQFGVEALVIGLAGAVLGIVLTWLGVGYAQSMFDPAVAGLARMDAGLLASTVAVAVLATLVAAFYPTWRAAQVQPAWQIKTDD